MSVTSPPESSPELPPVQPWDPQQGDLTSQHGIMPGQMRQLPPATPQQLHAAGWMDCPRCHNFWLSPENKAKVESAGGYFTCPKCRMTTDLLHNLPWHGVTEPDHYPKGNTGGGTAIGLPMADVGQIAENIVHKMGEIPGYGPIVWWHPGQAAANAPLDAATAEWGIEIKAIVYDSASHFWHPGSGTEVAAKNEAARQMGLQGVLGIAVVLNFRNDTADVYVKPMPLEPWANSQGTSLSGAVKWHKRTGQKIASNVPFDSPYKDPDNPAPGPYSMEDYYQRPQPAATPAPAGNMPF